MFDIDSVPGSPNQPMNQSPSNVLQSRRVTLYYWIGVLCAFVSLFIVPEIFGSAAIILGAYTWRLESAGNRNRGFFLIIAAIIAMFIGLYYTSFFALYQILP